MNLRYGYRDFRSDNKSEKQKKEKKETHPYTIEKREKTNRDCDW